MKSRATPAFWDLYEALPSAAQALADQAYARWREDPRYPSLRFKPLNDGLWSVRVGAHYRALGKFIAPDDFLWIWIGTHESYNKLL